MSDSTRREHAVTVAYNKVTGQDEEWTPETILESLYELWDKATEAALIPEPPRPQDISDDEREALKLAITDGYWQRTGYRVTWQHIGPLMDAIQAAGFRLDRGRGPITDEAVERRITFQYGPNSPQRHSGFGTHDELQRHIESVTAGPVHILKRESRTVGYGAWVDEAARDAEDLK